MSRSSRYSAAVLSAAVASLSTSGLSLSNIATARANSGKSPVTSSARTANESVRRGHTLIDGRTTADGQNVTEQAPLGAVRGGYVVVERSRERAAAYSVEVKLSDGTRLRVFGKANPAYLKVRQPDETVRSGTTTNAP
jgi:hypothetical protein